MEDCFQGKIPSVSGVEKDENKIRYGLPGSSTSLEDQHSFKEDGFMRERKLKGWIREIHAQLLLLTPYGPNT